MNSVELYTRQIVDRVTARPDQLEDPVEAALASWNLNGCSRHQTECTDRSDIRKIEIFEAGIVGDV